MYEPPPALAHVHAESPWTPHVPSSDEFHIPAYSAIYYVCTSQCMLATSVWTQRALSELLRGFCCWRLAGRSRRRLDGGGRAKRGAGMDRELEHALREFVAFRTVSSDPSLREDCYRGAKYLCKLLVEVLGGAPPWDTPPAPPSLFVTAVNFLASYADEVTTEGCDHADSASSAHIGVFLFS